MLIKNVGGFYNEIVRNNYKTDEAYYMAIMLAKGYIPQSISIYTPYKHIYTV